MAKQWSFVHAKAGDATWTPGLREIFDYRDLGIKDGTGGDYVAHIIKANGRSIQKGDCILQPPRIRHREIACSEDFEVLEVVSPADFGTRIVEGPQEAAA